MDRGAWQATEHGVTNSLTQLKQLGTHTVISKQQCYGPETKAVSLSLDVLVHDILVVAYPTVSAPH